MSGITADLTNDGEQINTGKDNVVIRSVLETIRGGKTLDVTGVAETVINAGHVIIKETATGAYKPMPVSSGAYGSLPSGHTYQGILINSILTKKPFAGILKRGSVNPTASPYPLTSILAAVKTALPLITFLSDQD